MSNKYCVGEDLACSEYQTSYGKFMRHVQNRVSKGWSLGEFSSQDIAWRDDKQADPAIRKGYLSLGRNYFEVTVKSVGLTPGNTHKFKHGKETNRVPAQEDNNPYTSEMFDSKPPSRGPPSIPGVPGGIGRISTGDNTKKKPGH